MSPADAWKALQEGNERFVKGEPLQPNQGVGRREEVSVVQNPHAVLFGCSDSRLAAEIIFDQGLGENDLRREAGVGAADENDAPPPASRRRSFSIRAWVTCLSCAPRVRWSTRPCWGPSNTR